MDVSLQMTRRRLVVGGILTMLFCTLSMPLCAQQSAADRAEIEQLKAELQRIEQRLNTIESRSSSSASGASAKQAASASQPAPAPASSAASSGSSQGSEAVKEAQEAGLDSMDAGKGGETIKIPIIPALKIRGFGDVRGTAANQNLAVINSTTPGVTTLSYQGGDTTFSLGLMDLFITSRVSEYFSYLSEVGFEADTASNGVGVDLERAQLTFAPSPYFSLSAGRTHAMLGYYNTAYHHGTWFQTTIDRPHIFEFEDSGGPLPIHNVGLATMGKIPSGKLGLHWLAEVGNGKQTYSLDATVTPANVLADHTGKSTNIGFFARPDAIDGMQVGFDWYQASVNPVISLLPGYGEPNFAFPNAVDEYKQNIFVGHAILVRPNFEFLVEGVDMRDLPRGSSQALSTSGGYAQISRVFHNNIRPYFRYQWLNPNFNDPNNAWVGRWVGPNAGVRYDINTYVAFKTELSRFDWKDFSTDADGNQILPVQHKTVNMLGMQLTYTF